MSMTQVYVGTNKRFYVADVAMFVGDKALAIFYDHAPTLGAYPPWKWLVLERATLTTNTHWQQVIRAMLALLNNVSFARALDQTLYQVGNDLLNEL